MTGLSIVIAGSAAMIGGLWVGLAARRHKRGALWAGILFFAAAVAGVVDAINNPGGIRVAVGARDLLFPFFAFVVAMLTYRLHNILQGEVR